MLQNVHFQTKHSKEEEPVVSKFPKKIWSLIVLFFSFLKENAPLLTIFCLMFLWIFEIVGHYFATFFPIMDKYLNIIVQIFFTLVLTYVFAT